MLRSTPKAWLLKSSMVNRVEASSSQPTDHDGCGDGDASSRLPSNIELSAAESSSLLRPAAAVGTP